MAGDLDLLKQKVVALQKISAELHNLILKLLRRTITGESVIQTASGWHIRASSRGSSAATSFRLCAVRTLDLVSVPQKAEAQEIQHNDDALLEGETYKHVVAVGNLFEVFPAPTWSYEMLRIEGASPRPFIPGENLTAMVPWWVDENNIIYPTLKFSPDGMSMLDPNETQQASGGIS